MKAREIERIRNRYPSWSFEGIQRTLDRLTLVMTKSPDAAKRKAAHKEATRWYSQEAIGVCGRKVGGPSWVGVYPECNHLHTEAPVNTNPKGDKICTSCFAKYVVCPQCHVVHHSSSLVRVNPSLSVCSLCCDTTYTGCQKCGKVHLKTETTVLGDGKRFCPECKASHTLACADCSQLFHRGGSRGSYITAQGQSGPWVCSSCVGNNWHACGGCSSEGAANGNTIYHRNGDECPEGYSPDDGQRVSCIAREGKFRFFNYHGNPFKDKVKTYMNQPTGGETKVTKFGLEMEVEGDFTKQARALTSAGFDERDLYAERDSTVDVEWVTRPMDIETLIPFLRKVTSALRPVAKAFDSRKSCGCHHNVDRHALTDEGWGRVCISISKYLKELRKFSGKHRSSNNFPMDDHEGVKPQKMLERSSARSKYCAAAFHKQRVVELRIAGMTLNEASLVTQAKIYSNLIANAADSAFDPRGSFESVFGPLDDEMLEVLRRKEILACPAGMVVPEDPERPGRKRRVACALPEGRVLANSWDFIIGDTLEVIHPDEMDDRFGRANDIGWDDSDMDQFVGKTVKVIASVRGSQVAEKRVVHVEFGSAGLVDKAKRFTFTAGMFHLAEAVPPRDPSLRDPYELRVGDVVVALADRMPGSMGYIGGAVGEVRFVDQDSVGSKDCAVKVKLLTRVVAPAGSDHLKSTWKYTAGMFRLAEPEEKVKVISSASYVPEGRGGKYDFQVGDILKFRTREDAKDDLDEAFFEIDYSPSFDFLVSCRARVVSVPAVLSSPLYQDSVYNRVLKVEILDKAEEYKAKINGRAKHAGEDFRFFTGMFEFERPGGASAPPPPSPYFFRKGERLGFRVIADTPAAERLDYTQHMGYLQGLVVVMDSPDAVVTPESVVIAHLADPIDQAEHESVLAGLGRSKDWVLRAGMFSRYIDPAAV